MKIGYIRVSTDKQITDLQVDAMKKEQVERTFADKYTGTRFDRPEFQKMLDMARPGDVIAVWRLDRLGRSLSHLIETVTDLSKRGIELRSLKETIDTTTPGGKLMFHIIGAMAEFEHDIIVERTKAGLEAARSRGHNGGRTRVIDGMSQKDIARAREMYAAKSASVPQIMKATGFKSRTTFYKYIGAR